MKSKISYLYLLIALAGFSSMGIVTKTIIGGVPSAQIVFLRFMIGGLVLLPLALFDIRKKNMKLEVLDVLKIAGLGFINVAISMNLGNLGLMYTSANVSAVLFGSNPIYVGVFAWLILKEEMNLNKWIGLVIGLVGVFITFSNAFIGADINTIFLTGAAYSISGAIIYALYTVLGKKVVSRIGSLTYTSLTGIFGSISSLPILFYQGIQPLSFDFKTYWLQIAYISIFVTAFAFYCYFKVLETENASFASMVFFFKPAVVVVLSAITIGEKVTINLIVGTIVLLLGVWIAKKGTERTMNKEILNIAETQG